MLYRDSLSLSQSLNLGHLSLSRSHSASLSHPQGFYGYRDCFGPVLHSEGMYACGVSGARGATNINECTATPRFTKSNMSAHHGAHIGSSRAPLMRPAEFERRGGGEAAAVAYIRLASEVRFLPRFEASLTALRRAVFGAAHANQPYMAMSMRRGDVAAMFDRSNCTKERLVGLALSHHARLHARGIVGPRLVVATNAKHTEMAPLLEAHKQLVTVRHADLLAATNQSDALSGYIADVLLSVHAAVFVGALGAHGATDQFGAVRLMRLGRGTASAEDVRLDC